MALSGGEGLWPLRGCQKKWGRENRSPKVQPLAFGDFLIAQKVTRRRPAMASIGGKGAILARLSKEMGSGKNSQGRSP